MLLGINMRLWTAHVGDDRLRLCESLKRLGCDGVELKRRGYDGRCVFEAFGSAMPELAATARFGHDFLRATCAAA